MKRFAVAAAALALVVAVPFPAHAEAARSGGGGHGSVLTWSRFDDTESGTARIVRGEPRGGAVRILTHPGPGIADVDPKVSPAGGRVLFERDSPEGFGTIGLVDLRGGRERILPLPCSDPCVSLNQPTWSPDGRRVVFTRVVGPFDEVNESARSAVLWQSDLDGRHVRRLSQPGIDGAYEDYQATFAPAGYIVFVRVRNADIRSAVFRMALDGSHVRRLTPWSMDADLPDVSPASSGPTKDLIAFETYGHGAPDGVSAAVATVPATCGAVSDCTRRIRYLTSQHVLPEQDFNVSWSPDGRRIAFCRFSYTEPGPAAGDIWTIRFDGTGARPVSTDSRFEFRPGWGRGA